MKWLVPNPKILFLKTIQLITQQISSIKPRFTSFYFILLHFTSFYFILLHFTSFYFILLNFTSLYFILLHFISLYFILLHLFITVSIHSFKYTVQGRERGSSGSKMNCNAINQMNYLTQLLDLIKGSHTLLTHQKNYNSFRNTENVWYLVTGKWFVRYSSTFGTLLLVSGSLDTARRLVPCYW